MKTCKNCKYFNACGDESRNAYCDGFELDSSPFNIAIQRYNECMFAVCYEYSTINTNFSENTENWNIRDMVAECDYVLSTYYEVGHANYDMKSGDIDERIAWQNETELLKAFIKDYEPFVVNTKCVAGHCSKYDNYKL